MDSAETLFVTANQRLYNSKQGKCSNIGENLLKFFFYMKHEKREVYSGVFCVTFFAFCPPFFAICILR